MNANRTNTASAVQFAPLRDLTVALEQPSSSRIRTFLEKTSLQLPQDGQYYLTLAGKELHVHETGQGIRDYRFKKPAEVAAFRIADGTAEIDLASGALRRIVLHAVPMALPAQAITLDELEAPVSLITEYAKLHAKPKPTAADLDRKRKLLHEISQDFAAKSKSRHAATRTSSRKRSPSAIRITGESAGGGRVSYGG